jgi:regulatory protein
MAASTEPPDRAELHDAALRHLARYGTTQTGLLRVLHRRIERWGRAMRDARDGAEGREAVAAQVAAARALAAEVVAALAAVRAVDDAAYANARASRLARGGRSSRVIVADLANRGVASEVVREALPGTAEAELAAAVILTRRRRIGAFRLPEVAEDARREAGVLARAGFPAEIARAALRMDREAAETLIRAFRRDPQGSADGGLSGTSP